MGHLGDWFRAAAIAAACVQMIGGCASAPSANIADSATVQVGAGEYARAFDAARRVLRDRGFILERVDARSGIITTQPKTTAGLATPWDREQQSLAQEVEDFLQRQQRVVRVTFEPAAGAEPASDGGSQPPENLNTASTPLTMRVQVTIERISVPGRRLEPEAIKESTYTYDPALGARGMQPSYEVATRRDAAGERRLVELIQAALAQ
jgi:hypothetical protein